MESLNFASFFSFRQTSLITAFTPQPTATGDNSSSIVAAPAVNESKATATPPDSTEDRFLNAIQRNIEPQSPAAYKSDDHGDSRSDTEHSAQRIPNQINELFGQLVKDDADEKDKVEFFHKIRKGMHNGFAEAHEMHRHRNHGVSTAQGVPAIQTKVEHGVNQLKSISEDTTSKEQAISLPQTAAETSLLATNFMRKDSSDLQVTTREGDVVTIRFNRETNRSIAAYQSVAGDTTQLGFQKERFGGATLSISVEGDLSETELKALRELIHRVDRVADKFFKGKDVALQKLLEDFSLDSEEIAAFNLDLKSEISKTLIAAQQKTEAAATANPDNSTTETADELQSIANEGPVTALLSEPQNAVDQVFSNSIAQRLQQTTMLSIVQAELRQLGLSIESNNSSDDDAQEVRPAKQTA